LDLFRRIRIAGDGWTVIAAVCLVLGVSVACYLSIGNHHASVAVLIAIMGLVVAAVTFRHEPGRTEKACWIALMIVLLIAEIRNLCIAHTEQNAKLETVSGNLTTAVSGINNTVNNFTGGNSYTYLVAMMGPHPPFLLAVQVVGEYPVRNVSADLQQVFETDSSSQKLQLRSMHSVALGSDWFGPGITLTKEFIHQAGRYVARVVSRNGDITEQIDIAQCSNGSWSQAIKMNGAGAKENDNLTGTPGCHKPF
jgi:hypothetical protein